MLCPKIPNLFIQLCRNYNGGKRLVRVIPKRPRGVGETRLGMAQVPTHSGEVPSVIIATVRADEGFGGGGRGEERRLGRRRRRHSGSLTPLLPRW